MLPALYLQVGGFVYEDWSCCSSQHFILKSFSYSGAGDQGLMFGYATDETEELMPLTCVLAHKLGKKLSECRFNGTMAYLRPDTKQQVTVEYANDNGACVPLRVHTIVVSTQHDETVTQEQIIKDVKEKIIKVIFY